MKAACLILFFLLSFYFSSCRAAFVIAASHTERVKVESYKIDNYKLTLVRKIDWAGPWYYGYELRRKTCGIYLPKKYYWCNRDSLQNCLVRFEGKQLILDKCNKTVIEQ